MRIRLKKGDKGDIPAMAELFRETVLTVNAADYSAAETSDWAACGDDAAHWEELLGRLHFVVAEEIVGKHDRLYSGAAEKEKMVGFASISDDGYLHSMFVHKGFQRCGVATVLLKAVEDYGKEKKVKKIISEVSITARPFFESEGYQLVCSQKRRARHLELRNFVMEKVL